MSSLCLLIVGASARAAAFSARRADIACCAADLFADADLVAVSPTLRITDYPGGFVEIAKNSPASAFMYTGGLENEPDLIDRLAQALPLWGNAGEVLHRVRNPFLVAEALRESDLPCPEVLGGDAHPPRDGTWLRKSARSCGGSGVTVYNANSPVDGDGFYQRRIEGRPHSALFVAGRGKSLLLGVTEQLIGPAWNAPLPFGYAGSIGPVLLDESSLRQWTKIGECLADRFSLIGLFGVDAIVGGGEIWPVEVNPRFTSSVEILERAGAPSAVGLHVDACRGNLWHERADWCQTDQIAGKLIIFAQRAVQAGQNFSSFVARSVEDADRPMLADIPCQGERIAAGRPVVTVLTDGRSRREVAEKLKSRAEMVHRVLDGDFTATEDHRLSCG